MGVRKCLLDMDGVLADFLGGVSKRHNRPLPYVDLKWLGIWDTEKGWGITPEEFWAPVDDFEFWEGLEKTPEADKIVKLAEEKFGPQNVAILTAPSKSPFCFTGKRAWLEKNYPQFLGKIIFGSAKEFLAHPNSYLIDDRDKNIEGFRLAGGHGILVPRDWNSEFTHRNLVMARVMAQLSMEMF